MLRRSAASLFGLLFSYSLYAQFSSSVQGIVQDQSGAEVANASVTLLNVATDVSQMVKADGSGNYRFPSLGPGQYTVTAEAPGFTKTNVTFTLETSQNLNVPINLQIASSSTQVEVTGAPPVIDTADTRNQQTLQNQTLQSLPLQGRNMVSLVTLAPGVVGHGTASGSIGSPTDNFNMETGVDASANGRSSNGNMFIVDGLDVTSNIRPGELNLVPNTDAIQEASIQVNTYGVDYGRASSIEMTMTTKSGTDQFHGLASDYFTYEKFWSGTEFAHNYAPFHTHNISANIGGPIIPHHQFFFFFDIEPLRSSVATGNSVITYEDPAFTNWAQTYFPNTLGTKLLTTYAPSGATTTGVSQTAAQLFPGTCGSASTSYLPCSLPVIDNGIFNGTNYRNGLQYNVRVDKYWSKDRLYGTFFRTTLDTGGPVARPAFTSTDTYHSNSYQVNETHTFTPTLLNEGSFAYLRIEGVQPSSGDFQVPAVTVTGISQGFGNGFALGDYVQHSYHWRDVLTKVRGTHELRVGYEGWHGDDLAYFASVHDQPSFTFNNLVDLVQDNPYSEGNLAYNPLTGKPKPGNYGYASTTGGIFAQDTWKIKPNLTINYGLRWDDYGNPYPYLQGTVLSNFFLGSGTTFDEQVASGVMKQVSHVLNHSMDNVWSPRAGVAWDPFKNGNWVLRGGFGLYHDMPTLGNLENGLNSNPPGYIVPTFYNNGTTSAPIFALGTSNTPPFGFPYPALGSTSLTPAGGLAGVQAGVGGVDPGLSVPTTMNYSATLEHRLFGNVVASVGYQGSHTYDEFWGYGNTGNTSYGFDVNRFAGDLIEHASTSPTRLNSSFGAITYATNGAKANYNAVFVDARGHFKRSYFDASYTHSRALDDTQTYPTVNIANYYGLSAFNAPNRFSLTWNYQVPDFRANQGFLGHLLSGWSISGTSIIQSGTPYTVYTNASFQPVIVNGVVVGILPASGDYNADGFNLDYPSVTSYSTPTSRQAYLNGVFTSGQIVQPSLGQEGNEKINQFWNPGFANTDAAVFKDTKLYERINLQLRFEVFNVFNRPNLMGVDANLADSTFGKATSQYNPRWLQVGARITF